MLINAFKFLFKSTFFKLSIFSKNLEPIAKNRLLELLSSLFIDDPNWIDDNLWKKYRDVIPIGPAVTWAKLIHYFQNGKSLNINYL